MNTVDNRITTSVKFANTEDLTLLFMQMLVIRSVNSVDRNTITERCTQGHVWVSVSTVECLVVIQKTKYVIAKR